MNRHDRFYAITSWLNDLANLTAGPTPLVDSRAKIGSLALALGEDFPTAAFTRQSLVAVARQCKFFPSYSEIVAILSPWWREHRPAPRAIAAPVTADQQERDERERAASWANITDGEIRAKIWALNHHPQRLEYGRLLATCINRHAPHKLGQLPPEFLGQLQPKAANDDPHPLRKPDA